MIGPIVTLGMKQGHRLGRERVQGFLMDALVSIAGGAGQAQVGELGFATGGKGHDVVDLEDGGC